MKNTTSIHLLLVSAMSLLVSCSNQTSTPAAGESAADTKELKTGGLYLLKNPDNTYYVSKILAMDNFAVHVRTYRNKFDQKPAELNSAGLDILIGHSPMDKQGFLSGSP